MTDKGHLDGSIRTVALLCDCQFCNTSLLGGAHVVISIKEHDDVGVVFDGNGIPQVTEHRSFIAMTRGPAGQLRQDEDGTLQLTG